MARLSPSITALRAMMPAQLKAEWRRLYRALPPALSPDLLLRGVAYRLQEKAHGGLSAAAERELLRLAGGASRPAADVPPRADTRLRPGTRLVRSWQGQTYAVEVTEDGYRYQDRHYASLTHIAREITGTHWSGPRFFGLTRTGKRASADA